MIETDIDWDIKIQSRMLKRRYLGLRKEDKKILKTDQIEKVFVKKRKEIIVGQKRYKSPKKTKFIKKNIPDERNRRKTAVNVLLESRFFIPNLFSN